MENKKNEIINLINDKLEWSEDDNVLYIKICNANITMVFYSKDISLIIDKKVNNEYSNKPKMVLNKNEQLEIFDELYKYVCDIKRHPFKLCERLGIDYLAGFQNYLSFSDINYDERLRLDIMDNTICEYILHNRNNNTIIITYDTKNQCKISSIFISNEHYENKDFIPIESILVSSIINYFLID